jgi:hypothetical protein
MRTWLVIALATVAGACGEGGGSAGGGDEIILVRDAALGAKYGVPGPRTCQDPKAPGAGPPSAAQAAALVACHLEGEFASDLYVLDQVTVTEIAPGRPYNPLTDGGQQNIDVGRAIHAIRGNMNRYQSRPIYAAAGSPPDPAYSRGTNCTRHSAAGAEGICFVDTFGDWHCWMIHQGPSVSTTRGTAPAAI